MTRGLVAAAALALSVSPLSGQDSVAVRTDFAAAAARLGAYITHEMKDKDLSAVSIVLVDKDSTVWARGFGHANPRDSVPATARTVYRVGSVSKLFTDIALMRLVERGALDLDAPITKALPDFHPANPFGGTITLRQLMTHHAGLVREPPLGSYFDSTAPPLADVVASLNRTAARRILEELVENALEFSDDEQPVVVRIDQAVAGIEVRVIDHGAGVAEDALERIFEPLEQAEDLHTRTHQGVGLGLTVARMSARAMDGDVTLERTGPQGSVFLWQVSLSPFATAIT